MPRSKILSGQALRTKEPPINYLMTIALERPELISLAAGFVDNKTLPVEEAFETCREIFGHPQAGRATLQYGTTQGHRPLRELLLERFLRRQGTTAQALCLTPDNVVLTSGSQQMLFLISSVLIDPGDIVLLPRPAYFVFASTLQIFGTRIVGIDIDSDGLRADLLDRRLAELDRAGQLDKVKLLYICSCCDNPTGLTASAGRREQIMEVVHRWRDKQEFFLLEDAAYRDLVYDPSGDVPPMKMLDPANEAVLFLQTFSKSLSPGMKTGFAFLPDTLLGPVLDQKASHDFGSANICQHLIYSLLTTGRADRHLQRLRKAYRAKRDAMLETLRLELGRVDGLRWTEPAGGLYVWLTLPESVNTDKDGSLFKRCLDHGVVYVPGSFCYCREPGFTIPRNHMRLSFSVPTVEENREGIARLASAIREEMA